MTLRTALEALLGRLRRHQRPVRSGPWAGYTPAEISARNEVNR